MLGKYLTLTNKQITDYKPKLKVFPPKTMYFDMKVVKLSLKCHFNRQLIGYCTLIPEIYGFYTIFFK